MEITLKTIVKGVSFVAAIIFCVISILLAFTLIGTVKGSSHYEHPVPWTVIFWLLSASSLVTYIAYRQARRKYGKS